MAQDDIVELAVSALADTYTDKSGGEYSDEELRAVIENATVSLKGRIDVPEGDLEAVVNSALSRRDSSTRFEVTRRKVARWFEIALDEFDQVPINRLNPDVLFRHVYYENAIAGWFEDWGYEVRIGEELEGVEGSDFIPDVYAEIGTLHGCFAVAVSLFCSNPPNTWRVLGMFENLEAFTKRAIDFSNRDIYLMVTPFKFLEQASNHVRIQSQEEDYYVVAVEGQDLEDLERSDTSSDRRQRMQSLVKSVAQAKSEETF